MNPGVSHPPLKSPSDAITPELVISHHRAHLRCDKGEQARSPPSFSVLLIIHHLIKGITVKDPHLFIIFA